MNFYEPIPKKNFTAKFNIPGSKSITNRALILAAFSGEKVLLKNILLSDDTKYMINALKELGNEIYVNEIEKTILIKGNKNPIFNDINLFIGNAGTAMRFIASYLATGKGTATLIGNDRMNQRPIKDLVNSLTQLGVKITYLKDIGYPPIKLECNHVSCSYVEIDGSQSSQYISSILMAAGNFKNRLTIKLLGKIVSKPYIQMTLNMISKFGGNYVFKDNVIEIFPCNYSIKEYSIEGDMSSASYFLALALISNSTVTLNNFAKNSIQGDSKFLHVLEKMGLETVSQNENSITIKGKNSYTGISIDMNDIPDVAQTLAAVAIFATTPTKVTNVANMRIKETDRISALKNELEKLNVTFIEEDDAFEIIPKPLNEYKGTFLETYDDHRMAMSLSLTGLKIPGVKILDPQCVSKTFPNFFQEFSKIYREES